ncbi:hypothetical protein PoB_007354200 [Plakobranchus ocellatus]|uniref:C-type lectin domain-containing protein n=1 Tax=Plakobranchus ocellatus TaxID=259542 RepID=A0AAV4DRU9_9GAST|nr:hypothetical protein PoB_007354200 [Plakobranchus ocellatus]
MFRNFVRRKSKLKGKKTATCYSRFPDQRPFPPPYADDRDCVIGSIESWADVNCRKTYSVMCQYFPPVNIKPRINLLKVSYPLIKLECAALHGQVFWDETYGGTVEHSTGVRKNGLKFFKGLLIFWSVLAVLCATVLLFGNNWGRQTPKKQTEESKEPNDPNDNDGDGDNDDNDNDDNDYDDSVVDDKSNMSSFSTASESQR